MNELKPCPFCGEEIEIKVYDDEGNCHGELGCDYEKDPWSGLAYGLVHDRWGKCPAGIDGSDGQCMGGMLFDTVEEAIETWNKRIKPIE